MGKVVFGGGLSLISGRVGGVVYARNRGGYYVRNYVPTPNPNTTHQSTVRGYLTSANASWQGLTSAQRGSWNGYADSLPRVDRIGRQVKLTGRQVYIGMAIQVSKRTGFYVAPSLPVVGTFYKNSGLPNFSPIFFFGLDFFGFQISSTTPLGTAYMIEACPPLAPTRNFYTNQFRSLPLKVVDSDDKLFDIALFQDQYFAYFGITAFPTGQKIVIRPRLFQNGLYSTPKQIVAIAP